MILWQKLKQRLNDWVGKEGAQGPKATGSISSEPSPRKTHAVRSLAPPPPPTCNACGTPLILATRFKPKDRVTQSNQAVPLPVRGTRVHVWVCSECGQSTPA